MIVFAAYLSQAAQSTASLYAVYLVCAPVLEMLVDCGGFVGGRSVEEADLSAAHSDKNCGSLRLIEAKLPAQQLCGQTFCIASVRACSRAWS